MDIEKPLIGPWGEAAAVAYLKTEGYDIIDTNYQVCGAEVDVVARKDDTLCFVEVKTRGADDFGLPEEFVDRRKRSKIIRAAKVFIGCKEYDDYYVRFDIISVLHRGETPEIRHIRHAFQEE